MSQRQRCFFDIEVDGIPSGRIIFELFNDVCPKTCENFRCLCTGEQGIGKTTKKALHYQGVKFHRVIKDFMIQGGDFSLSNGTGGESIYGGQFEDENFELTHDRPFLLSMANRGKDTNGSQFFITTQPASHLDGKHVVFGQVVAGQDVVVAVEGLPVDNRSRPLQTVIISSCGELVLQYSGGKKHKRKSSRNEEERSRSKKKKKKEKKRKHSHHRDDSTAEEDESVEDTNVHSQVVKRHPLVSVSIIDPDEIPEVPRNRFLYRDVAPRNENPNFPAQKLPPFQQQDRGYGNFYERSSRPFSRVRNYTKSGRKVKGRGSLRFRTPSRSRSRSVTPPHWKQAQRRTITLEELKKREEVLKRREEESERRRKKREERHRLQDEEDRKKNLENSDSPETQKRANHRSLSKSGHPEKTDAEPVNGTSRKQEDALDELDDTLLDYEIMEDEDDGTSGHHGKKGHREKPQHHHRHHGSRRSHSPRGQSHGHKEGVEIASAEARKEATVEPPV